jgi:transposase
MLAAQLRVVKEQILENDRRIMARARETELGRRLMEIPGVGPLLASAFVATIADPTIFRSGATSPRGLAWCRARTPAAARNGSAASPRPATVICARC